MIEAGKLRKMESNGDTSAGSPRTPDAGGDRVGIGISSRLQQLSNDANSFRQRTCRHNQSKHNQKHQSQTSDILSEFQRHTTNIQSLMNEKIFDIVEAYEKRIQLLEKDLEYYQKKHQGVRPDAVYVNPTSLLCKREASAVKLNQLEDKVNRLQLEKQSWTSTKVHHPTTPQRDHSTQTPQSPPPRRPLELHELYAALNVSQPHQVLPAVHQLRHSGNTHRQELCSSINALLSTVVPWSKTRLVATDSWSEVAAKLQSLNHTLTSIINQNEEPPPNIAVEDLIHHFQLLFDVPSVCGIYPTMNQVYTRLAELNNIMKILNNMLGLDPSCKAATVVDAVNEICEMHNATTSTQLKHLLHTQDLESIIKKLEEYDSFFPAFHSVMVDLLNILNVSSLSDVIPAVKSLTLLSH